MRWQLERVLDRVAALTDDERSALFEPATARVGDRHEQVRLAVRRHRLRTRLRAGLEGVAALVAVPRAVVRRAALATRPRQGLAAGAAAAAIVPLMLVTLGAHRSLPDEGTGRDVALAVAPDLRNAVMVAATSAPRVAHGPAPTGRAAAAPPSGGAPTGPSGPAAPQLPRGKVDQGSRVHLTPPAPIYVDVSYRAQHQTPSSPCPVVQANTCPPLTAALLPAP
jgi:hypothetical protein